MGYYENLKAERSRGVRRHHARWMLGPVSSLNKKIANHLCNRCCAYCGGVDDLTFDHIVAVAVGGLNNQGNILVACRSCNSKKYTKDVDEWLATQPESYQQNYEAYKKRKAIFYAKIDRLRN